MVKFTEGGFQPIITSREISQVLGVEHREVLRRVSKFNRALKSERCFDSDPLNDVMLYRVTNRKEDYFYYVLTIRASMTFSKLLEPEDECKLRKLIQDKNLEFGHEVFRDDLEGVLFDGR